MSLFNAPIATCSSPSSLLPGIGTGGQKQREHRSPQTSTRRAAAARPAARRLARQPPLQRHAVTPAHHPPAACAATAPASAWTNTHLQPQTHRGGGIGISDGSVPLCTNWNFGWQRSPLHGQDSEQGRNFLTAPALHGSIRLAAAGAGWVGEVLTAGPFRSLGVGATEQGPTKPWRGSALRVRSGSGDLLLILSSFLPAHARFSLSVQLHNQCGFHSMASAVDSWVRIHCS